MCKVCAQMRPHDPDCPYTSKSDSGTDGEGVANSTQPWTVDQVADQLTTGYWSGGPYSFNVSPGGSLLVNLTGLNATGQTLARMALDSWTDVTGINFTETTGGAHITFDDNNSGAYASFSFTGDGRIVGANINVSTSWVGSNDNFYSYGMQTYIHEIGHALGLGHAGNYNGGATYGVDNNYANDSWQMSVMSYFSQTENTAITASYAFAVTPMIADIQAIQDLYGVGSTRTGDTVYGVGGNTGTYLDDWLTAGQSVAVTLYDSGGTDLVNLSSSGASQRVDLAEEAISDVNGLIGNMIIARGTVIENVITGQGDDDVTGNNAANLITLGQGDDTARGMDNDDVINGGMGDDFLLGGDGNDTLNGDLDADRLEGGDGDDIVNGGAGFDLVFGGLGNDTVNGGNQADNVFGGAGNDILYGEAGLDRLSGEAGDDQIFGGDGNDVLFGGTEADQLYGDAGDDRLFGGSGFDLLRGGADNDELRGELQADNLYGDGGNDDIYGDQGADRLFGGTGNDSLWGGVDNDALFGGGGNDTLRGESGNDHLRGESGDDILTGGANSDVFLFEDGFGADTITDFNVFDALELIDLSAVSSIVSWADLLANHLSDIGADVLIDAGSGDTITLAGLDLGDLASDDFIF